MQLVHKRIDAFATRWRDTYPAAAKDGGGVAWPACDQICDHNALILAVSLHVLVRPYENCRRSSAAVSRAFVRRLELPNARLLNPEGVCPE